jgi:hypothetical protein
MLNFEYQQTIRGQKIVNREYSTFIVGGKEIVIEIQRSIRMH